MIRQVQRGSGLIRRDEMPGFRVEMPHWGEGGYRDGCAVTNRYFPILEPKKREDQERPPGGGLFRLRRVTWKSRKSHHPQVTKGACSWFGPPSSGSLTPTKLRGPAPNGHPCPSGALAASVPLGPLRVVCVRPAPKSRLAVFEPLAYEDQKQIEGGSGPDCGLRILGDLWERACSRRHWYLRRKLVFETQHSRASSLPQGRGCDQHNCWRLDWPLPG